MNDDPDEKYHDPDNIKSMVALQNEAKIVMMYLKKGFIVDKSDADMAVSMIKTCAEEMAHKKWMNLD